VTAPTAGAAGRRRPPGRYDEPRRLGQRLAAAALGLLVLGFLAAAGRQFWLRTTTEQVRTQVLAYEVVGEDAVRVEFSVDPPGERVWCLVRARNEAGAEVGRVFVPVDPEGDATVRVEHVLPTRDVPVTGEVPRCLATDPPAGEPTARPATGPDPASDP
jgi:hypothetical protein